ncbi:MAG: hypothetical protein KIT80_18730 [Chitinophagaceae bacterium]|nr:hypothetical protein [Chitinophagaceae bacterium]MCW5928963.1 hypothetical protein [Chitinophagaceae bacterium]
MNTRILLLAVAAVGLGSCSTIYKSGQTPDDVYYSPAPQQRVASNQYSDDDDGYVATRDGEYVNVQTDQDRAAYNAEDNYLRMKVRNRAMWSSLDYYDPYLGGMAMSPYFGSGWRMGMGLGYGYGGLGFGYNSFYNPYWGMGGLHNPYWGMGSMYNPYWGMGSFYNPYWGYGSFYNPYFYGGGLNHGYYPGGTKYNTRPASSYAPRTSNLNRYNRTTNNANVSGRNTPVRVFRNNDNGTYVNPRTTNSSGRTRSTLSSGSDSRPSRSFESRSSNSAPTRSFTPSSSSGRSSSGGSSGGGGGSAPSRGAGRGG